MISKLFSRVISSVFVVLAFYFLIHSFVNRWQEVQHYQLSIHFGWLLFSFVWAILSLWVSAFAWIKIMGDLAPNAAFSRHQALRVFSLSFLSRYIPGKVWEFASRAYLASQDGISKTVTVVSMAYEMTFLIISGMILFVFFTPLPPIIRLGVLAITVLAMVLVSTTQIHQLGIWILKKLRLLDPDAHVPQPRSQLRIAWYVVVWILFGIGFGFFALAVVPEIRTAVYWPTFILNCVSAFSIAVPIGALVLIAPAGLGAREGLLVILLKTFMPLPLAIVLSIAGRLWTTAGEIIFMATTLPYIRIKKGTR